jgi:hypothetical protein
MRDSSVMTSCSLAMSRLASGSSRISRPGLLLLAAGQVAYPRVSEMLRVDGAEHLAH